MGWAVTQIYLQALTWPEATSFAKMTSFTSTSLGFQNALTCTQSLIQQLPSNVRYF